jgi:hypothetical protein
VVERQDVEAALRARHELGPEYEPEILDALVDKIERRLDERQRQLAPPPSPPRHDLDLRLVLGSFGFGIAATAIATGNGQGWVAVIAWIAIVVVNVAYMLRR